MILIDEFYCFGGIIENAEPAKRRFEGGKILRLVRKQKKIFTEGDCGRRN